METARNIWNWIFKNTSNLLGFFGLIATIYFGAFYIPDYLKEIKDEKIRSVNRDLIRTTKELIFNDSTVNSSDIQILIESKKIAYDIEYPFSAKELLFFVQESFMEDNFLPLNTRKELFDSIEGLKSNIRVEDSNDKASFDLGTVDFLGVLSALISIVFAIVAFISSYRKRQLENAKEEELTSLEEQVRNESSAFERHQQFEHELTQTLKQIDGVKIVNQEPQSRIDISFTYRNRSFYVEVKSLMKSKVAQSSVAQFLLFMTDHNGIGLFIYNTELTQMAIKRIDEFNRLSTSKVYPIKLQNPKDKLRISNTLESIAASYSR